MTAIWLLTLWLALLVAGDTATGRIMRRILVEVPARALRHVQRGQWLMLAGLLILGGALAWLTDGEATRLMTMAAPELAGMLASVEIGTFVEVLTAALVTGATVRSRAVLAQLYGLFSRRGARTRRTRSTPQRHSPANDDERDAAAWAA